MEFKVGQIIYVVLKKDPSVYPMQVCKEITEKTLEGMVTTYMVRAGADPDKVMTFAQVESLGEVFDSADKAKKTLVDRVTNSISTRVDHAVAKAKEWYPSGFESAVDDPLSLLTPQTVPKAQAQRPQQPVKRPVSSVVKPEVAELAQELAAESEEMALMEIPDGNGGVMKAKVKNVKLPPELG